MSLTAKKVYAILKRQISDMEAKLNSPIRYRGTVATADLLPLNPDIGDMYNIESKSIYGEAGMNVAWNGVVWDTMGAPIDMSLYFTKEEAEAVIQRLVTEYLEKNPVKPGATTEQAQQIEQNKTDIGSLKTETGSLKEDIIGLESELIETVHGKNLLDISKCTANSYINSDTGIIEHDDRRKGYVTDLIPVKEGYKLVSSYYLNKVTHPYDMLSIAHYDANKNFIPLFTTNIDIHEIPSGVAYVRCTIHKNLFNYNGQLELNKDGIATTYAPYVDPFVKLLKKLIDNSNLVTHDELNENESKTVVAKGFNMIEVCETGIGAYHASGGDIKFEPSYTAYAYIIANVKKNTRYIYKTIGESARWAILVDEKNDIIKSFVNTPKRYFDTENATKLYITLSTHAFDNGVILSEGTNGQSDMIKVPVGCEDSFYRQTKETYACALPVKELHFTKGWDEKFYFDSILTPYKNNVFNGRYKSEDSTGIIFNSSSSSNHYKYDIYDEQLNRIDNNCICQIVSKPINLSDKTALVIGDSTVDFDTMTAKMLELFTENGSTLTLLGTLGDGTTTNKNEGRSGWTTSDYFTNKKYNDVVNPFYNPDTETFDFKYYMNQQGYTSVDFVIIQLGINDLYNATNNYESASKNAISNIKKMIDSVFVFNDSIKVIINLPTTPNSDKSKHSVSEPLYRNRVIKYNELAQIELTDYPESKVRTSYCHLILDSKTDISDNVHPNTEGFAKMAKEDVSQMNVWMNS